MAYIRSADAALYYEEYGAGETLILIPGMSGTIELDWRRFIPEFARHFHTVAIDLRGHGKTNNPSGALRIDQLLADLLTLHDTLEIDRAFLCSHGSMAILPLLFALRWPDRVLGVILHAPGVAQQNGKGSPGDNADPALTKDVHDFWDTIALAKFSALRTIELPLLITMSRDHGPDMPEMSETLGRAVPKSSTVVLPASGRALTMVQKQEFIDAAVTFSRRVLGSRGE